MNTQPRHPKCRALPVELHPDIQFPPLYHGEGKNQRFFCLWSFMWSKPFLYRFRQSKKIQQTQVSQGFAGFRLAMSRIPPRHSQTRRDTNFAIPGYSLFCHDTTANGKNKAFSACGHSCGQSCFCAVFSNREKPAIACVARLCGVSPCPVPDTATAHPNHASSAFCAYCPRNDRKFLPY